MRRESRRRVLFRPNAKVSGETKRNRRSESLVSVLGGISEKMEDYKGIEAARDGLSTLKKIMKSWTDPIAPRWN